MMGPYDWSGEMTVEHRKKETEVLPVGWDGKTFGEAMDAVDALVDERLVKRGVRQVSVSVRARGNYNLLISSIKGKG